MSDDIFNSSDSVRSAKPLTYAETWTLPDALTLQSGAQIRDVTVLYETYGTLNKEKSNAIFICHALSGDSHVTAHDERDDPGWWEVMVGPGKPIDTNRYFIICANMLGGCRGTTGPDSVNPETGRRYGTEFPPITVADIVELNRRLVSEHLGIKRLLAIIGGSLGGHTAMDWATRFSDEAAGCAALATSAHVSSQSLAFDIVARNAIMSDPHFYDGQYYDKKTVPAVGLAIARMLGHITYLSRESMTRKFDVNRNVARQIDSTFETKFSVGSYLAYQADKFVERFDANSYLTLSYALDSFDLGETPKLLAERFARSTCRWLFVSFSSDWLFPAYQSRELVTAALAGDKRVSYCNVQSDCGHDAFLLENEIDVYGDLTRSFLRNLVCEETAAAKKSPKPWWNLLGSSDDGAQEPPKHHLKHRIDYDRILDLIPPDKTVLDLGCGRGDLLLHLRERGNRGLVGLEREERYIMRCVERGLDVIHADLDEGLRSFYDRQFDYVVLSKTLQTVRNVELIIEEMLRVGKEAVVSFPNFGYHRFRTGLEMFGTAPQTDTRPGKKWYNTNDVRFLTISDFEEFCAEKGYNIHRMVALDTEQEEIVTEDQNVLADVAIVVIRR